MAPQELKIIFYKVCIAYRIGGWGREGYTFFAICLFLAYLFDSFAFVYRIRGWGGEGCTFFATFLLTLYGVYIGGLHIFRNYPSSSLLIWFVCVFFVYPIWDWGVEGCTFITTFLLTPRQLNVHFSLPIWVYIAYRIGGWGRGGYTFFAIILVLAYLFDSSTSFCL